MYLETKDIVKSYNGELILQNINIKIMTRECVALLGPSGVGKTTLFNILSGLERPDSGSVLLNGEDVTGKAGMAAYMQQQDLLMPFKTVENNVILPLILQGMKKKEALNQAIPFFERFGLAEAIGKYPSQLSGGMRQRAALLRAYLFKSDMLLLDEPFSSLDTLTKTELNSWFAEVTAQNGITSLLITHDIDEAILLSDRIYIMSSKPGTITSEIAIDKNSDFSVSEQFLKYKKNIVDMLNNMKI